MIYGQSFEAGPSQTPPLVYSWWNASDATVQGSATLDPTTHVNPTLAVPSLKLQYTGGTGFLGWGNRGLGSEGLAWRAGQLYEGFLWVHTTTARKVTVRMVDRIEGTVTAQQSLNVSGSSAWQRVNFTLTPATTADCTWIAPGSDPTISCSSLGPNPGHICVRCAGEFQAGVTAAASDSSALWIGFVQLEPGSWGRYEGLSVQSATVQALLDMGVSVIRQGGTVSQTFKWKDWRGAPWARPSMQHVWGSSLVAPWGPFEFLDMCAAAGIESVLTFAYDLNSAQDWADLIEYAWGNASTPWGSVRITNDSHPEPYLLRTLELGNEQWNPDYVQQITAMEEKRREIGAPELYYMFPTNDGYSSSMAQQLLQLGGQELLSRTLPDCHVWEGGGVECATTDFQALAGYNISFINAEVNAQHSDVRRAITEAADLQDWFNMNASLQSRMRARTASFCTERSGHFDGFDQGLIFFLPNTTWVQPPGWTHAMIHSVLSQARSALKVSVSQAGPPGVLTASSQLSDDSACIFIQLVNSWNSVAPANVAVSLTGGFNPSGSVIVSRLTGVGHSLDGSTWEFAGNTPAVPDLITPQQSTLYWPPGASSLTLQLPPYSFTVLQVYGS